MTDYERVIAESLFRRGNIRLLAATSTLSAGVNLNVDVVVIDGLSRCKTYYTSTEYKQMIGRTGRMGQSKQGRVYVLLGKEEHPQWTQIRSNLLASPNPSNGMTRYLRNAEYWEKAIIELIACDMAVRPNTLLQTLYQHSLFVTFTEPIPPIPFLDIHLDPSSIGSIQCDVSETVRSHSNPLLPMLCTCFLRLLEKGFIMVLLPVEKEISECTEQDVEVVLTELGDAAYAGNVSLSDVITIAQQLTNLNNALDISNTFQILYHLTPLTLDVKISIDLILLYIETHLSETDVAYINRDVVPIQVLYALRNGSSYDVTFSYFLEYRVYPKNK